jgi:hypothetical protein
MKLVRFISELEYIYYKSDIYIYIYIYIYSQNFFEIANGTSFLKILKFQTYLLKYRHIYCFTI